jgi:hypothetical protein
MEMGELENEEDAAQDVQDVGSGDEGDLADPEVCVCVSARTRARARLVYVLKP